MVLSPMAAEERKRSSNLAGAAGKRDQAERGDLLGLAVSSRLGIKVVTCVSTLRSHTYRSSKPNTL